MPGGLLFWGAGTLGLVDRTHGVSRPRMTEPGRGAGLLGVGRSVYSPG